MNKRVIHSLHPSFDYDYIQESLIQALAGNARLLEVPIQVKYSLEEDRPAMSSHVVRYISRFLTITGFSLARFYPVKIKNLFKKSDHE